ncbi:MAG: efflux RND transporter periplasmic adaptor subunit [Planctomyces sp.]|nr:efflux RND transporter periplasmic adaptor subunit [Planctomyces sp.]
MSQDRITNFRKAIEQLDAAIEAGDNWIAIRPLVLNSVRCFCSASRVQLWIQNPGIDHETSPEQEQIYRWISTDGEILLPDAGNTTDKIPTLNAAALSKVAARDEITMVGGTTQQQQLWIPGGVYCPGTLKLPNPDDNSRQQHFKYVLLIISQSPGELTTDVRAAFQATVECLSSFVIRFILLALAQHAKAAIRLQTISDGLRAVGTLSQWVDQVTALGVTWLTKGRVSVLSEACSPGLQTVSGNNSPDKVLGVTGYSELPKENSTAVFLKQLAEFASSKNPDAGWIEASQITKERRTCFVRIERLQTADRQNAFQILFEVYEQNAVPSESEYQQVLSWIRSSFSVFECPTSKEGLIHSIARHWITAGAFVAVFIWMLLPTDFDIELNGQAFPEQRRRIFAPIDAIVEKIKVAPDELVEANTEILSLRSPELDLSISRLEGEIETVEVRLRSLRTLRTVSPAGNSASRETGVDLSTEEQQAESQLKRLQAELALAFEKRSQLNVTSSFAGRVYQRTPLDELLARPVNRGEVLLEIVDSSPEAIWTLELIVQDQHSGYLQQAIANSQQLVVNFAPSDSPEAPLRATLQTLSHSASDSEIGPVRTATATVDSSAGQKLRPGMEIRASVHCGRRMRGFVWFREVIEFLQRKSFAWF